MTALRNPSKWPKITWYAIAIGWAALVSLAASGLYAAFHGQFWRMLTVTLGCGVTSTVVQLWWRARKRRSQP